MKRWIAKSLDRDGLRILDPWQNYLVTSACIKDGSDCVMLSIMASLLPVA